jgi:hypothetical protein
MTMLHRYFTKWKLRVNINKTEAILFTKRRPVVPSPLQFQHTAIPWSPHIRHHGLMLDSKLLFTKHLHSVIHRATGTFFKIFPLLARDSTLFPHKNSPCTNYWSTLYSHTLPPSGEMRRLVTTLNFKFFNLDVLESLVIILNAPPSHTCTLLLTSNLFTSLFTVWLINFSIAVQLTLTLLFVK